MSHRVLLSLRRKKAKGYAPKSVNRPEYASVCRVLRCLRVEAGITQADLAGALERTQTYVSAVERGITRMDPLQLRAWCMACRSSLEAFGKRLEQELK